ncbi:hypothetical protein HED50_08805 [Ochrobactrum oryzae]|nr:hypothetical protein [Brucella oryzae]
MAAFWLEQQELPVLRRHLRHLRIAPCGNHSISYCQACQHLWQIDILRYIPSSSVHWQAMKKQMQRHS